MTETQSVHSPMAKSATLAKILENPGGFTLIFAAIIAMCIANAQASLFSFLGGDFIWFSEWFSHFMHQEVIIIGATKTVHHWINDGVMTIFFYGIGLEVKRELFDEKGGLNTLDKALLPALVAAGGVAVPALIYFSFNGANPETSHGWAIPTATDIAFALGILLLVKSRVPMVVKVFLLAIAVIDDLMAIGIIAVFYSNELNLTALAWALIPLTLLFIQNRMKSNNIFFYLLWAMCLWICILSSGIHATIAGVVSALMVPTGARLGADKSWSLLKTMEHQLSPINAWFVMPLFALANAGVSLAGVTFNSFLNEVTLGVALALILGKLVGIVGFSFVLTKLTPLSLPTGMTFCHLVGVGFLAGIGFTMSIFVTELAFMGHENAKILAEQAKLGILTASTLAAVLGILWFSFFCSKVKEEN